MVLALLTSMCDNLDHVISCLQAVFCVDLRAEIICPDLNLIPRLSQASHGLVVSLHTTVDAESQNISSVSKS